MTWIDLLNYQPFGNLRIMHFIMLFVLCWIAWFEWKEYKGEKKRKKFKKIY